MLVLGSDLEFSNERAPWRCHHELDYAHFPYQKLPIQSVTTLYSQVRFPNNSTHEMEGKKWNRSFTNNQASEISGKNYQEQVEYCSSARKSSVRGMTRCLIFSYILHFEFATKKIQNITYKKKSNI